MPNDRQISATKRCRDWNRVGIPIVISEKPVIVLERNAHRATASYESYSYGRFLLSGPYSDIWMAFDRIFKTLSEERVTLRPEFCIENYLNDPRVTPEDQLQTQLLVPIA